MTNPPRTPVSSAEPDAAARSKSHGVVSLERFDPRDGAGKLIDSEHRGRYWWASQTVIGKDALDAGCGVGYGLEILASAGAATVTGVDIDEEAIGEARKRFGDTAEAIVQGDLRELPFHDESFDVVVCFETIEHVEAGERALGELYRVLRPDGLLLISSPNPDVYLEGNEHHVHEYRPAELAAILGERFANVASYRQHPWLASVIEPAAGSGSALRRRETRATAKLDPGGETYSIHVASDGDLPSLDGLLTLGGDFEVRWWAEQAASGREEGARAAKDALKEIATAEEKAREHIEIATADARKEIANAERRAAIAEQGTADAIQRLQETSAALLDANKELAQLPLLNHRLAELQGAEARAEILENSRSWRYMAPIRRLWRLLGLRRE